MIKFIDKEKRHFAPALTKMQSKSKGEAEICLTQRSLRSNVNMIKLTLTPLNNGAKKANIDRMFERKLKSCYG